MIDIYKQFIETKEIKKDINFYNDIIRNKILLDIFPKYLYEKRKKINYSIENCFSKLDKTALKFKNDLINITFIVDDIEQSFVKIEKLEYDNFQLDLILDIRIVLTSSENKNKIIYEDNKIFHNLQKTINQ